jgi:hypothetical protein
METTAAAAEAADPWSCAVAWPLACYHVLVRGLQSGGTKPLSQWFMVVLLRHVDVVGMSAAWLLHRMHVAAVSSAFDSQLVAARCCWLS